MRPTVGVAGFILGGGFGGFTRYAGLGADNLIAIKGVDANGNVVVADKDTNPELLWASRGAGGGKFVVVTDFHVRLMDVTPGAQRVCLFDWLWIHGWQAPNRALRACLDKLQVVALAGSAIC